MPSDIRLPLSSAGRPAVYPSPRRKISLREKAARAFTLIELLVVMTIIAILAGLIFAVTSKVQDAGRNVKETNAARQLIAAYLAAAADRDGELLVAYYEGRSDEVDAGGMTLPDGTALTAAELHRYPFRLASYLKFQIDGTILVNRNDRQTRKKFTGSMFNYGVSLCPAFGINYYFVGGYKVDGELQGVGECATALSQVAKPSSLLVLATAFSDVDGERIEGRFGVEPPNYKAKLWDVNLHVDPRHNGRALCAFLDGSVRHYTVDELRDMRFWSKNAAATDNANYTVAVTGSTGIGGGGRR